MTWFTLSLFAGLAFATSRVIARFLLCKEGNPIAFTALHSFAAGLVLLPFGLYFLELPEHPITWLWFGGLVLFAFLSDWIAFAALKLVDVSIYQIVNQIRHGIILFGGFLLFSEPITELKVLSVLLITLGVAIALYEKGKFVFNRGIVYTCLSAVAAVIAFLFVKEMVVDFSEISAASFELLLLGVIGFAGTGFRPGAIKKEWNIQKWGVLIAGALFGIFEILLFLALSMGEASRVVPTIQSSLVFTVLAGIFLLGERDNLFQKIIGLILASAGIVLLSL